uniref:Uncharacterized protein n=1 Tax=Ursus maritimus TaxID=29073 RepID=A0A452V091_URSMA
QSQSGLTLGDMGGQHERCPLANELWGIYDLATDRNDFWRNLTISVGLFAGGVWPARKLRDTDLMAPQPGVQPNRHMEPLSST